MWLGIYSLVADPRNLLEGAMGNKSASGLVPRQISRAAGVRGVPGFFVWNTIISIMIHGDH